MIGWIVFVSFVMVILYIGYCRLRYTFRQRNGLNEISPKDAMLEVMRVDTWMTNDSIRSEANNRFAGKISTYNGKMPENRYLVALHELENLQW